MLEGACENSVKEFSIDKVMQWTEPVPAGQKRKAEDEGAEASAQKAASSEQPVTMTDAQRADAIFGKSETTV